MKKLLPIAILLFLCVSFYESKADFIKAKATMDIEYSKDFNEIIYPSFIYTVTELARSTGDKEASIFFSLNIKTNKRGDYKIVIKENKLIEETILNTSLNEGENTIPLNLNWKFNDFVHIRTPGFVTFSAKLIDNETDQELTNAYTLLNYRSSNECVYGMTYNNSFSPTGQFFLAYVNEDKTDLIDPFLAIARDNYNKTAAVKLSGWNGYQSGAAGVSMQILAIVQELNRRGFSYSNITDTSNTSKNILSQYVRFTEQSLYNTEANCVEGTVLLASLLTRIGIECALVIVPGHMYLGYKQDPNVNSYTPIETTAIGNNMTNFKQYVVGLYANINSFNSLIAQNKFNGSDINYQFIPIKYWRQYIKPIQ